MLATQNPLEMEGTYPLPEAQLDRFFFKLLVQFPKSAEIETILDRTTEAIEPRAQPVFDGERILELARLARQIPIADEIRRYGISIVLATHPENALATEQSRRFVRYGSSPRGAQAMILAAKIRAILDHRYHVSREDLRAVAVPALRHRLILNFEGQAEGVQADADHRGHPRERRNAGPRRLSEHMALFDSDFLKKLEYLSLVSRRVFRGQLLAQRRTMQLGGGIEFADHREYTPGDDFRYLDWNLYARHDELLLKRFQEEEDLHVYFLLDCSRSMGFGDPPKFDFARQVTAALAYIALADLDRMAVVAFRRRYRRRLPADTRQGADSCAA